MAIPSLRRRPNLSTSRPKIASSEIDPKMRLLLLCARIGYSPPASSKH
jgi:hypothetical protein